jgi:tetratricopeptide (TPR) repeat protein
MVGDARTAMSVVGDKEVWVERIRVVEELVVFAWIEMRVLWLMVGLT